MSKKYVLIYAHENCLDGDGKLAGGKLYKRMISSDELSLLTGDDLGLDFAGPNEAKGLSLLGSDEPVNETTQAMVEMADDYYGR